MWGYIDLHQKDCQMHHQLQVMFLRENHLNLYLHQKQFLQYQ